MDSEGVVNPLNNKVFDPKMVNHTLIFYHFHMSPVSRAALLLTRALGIKHTVEIVNILNKEQMSQNFIKLNPLHTVPVINDRGFILYDRLIPFREWNVNWCKTVCFGSPSLISCTRPVDTPPTGRPLFEDHNVVFNSEEYGCNVIMKYLASQYGKDDSLYPKSPKMAALVDLRLFFSATYLFPRFGAFHVPTMFHGSPPDEENRSKLDEALQFLDKFLENQKWVAGDNMTIADFSIITIIATIEAAGTFDLSTFSNIWSWYQNTRSAMEGFGYEEVCQKGADAIGMLYKSKLK